LQNLVNQVAGQRVAFGVKEMGVTDPQCGGVPVAAATLVITMTAIGIGVRLKPLTHPHKVPERQLPSRLHQGHLGRRQEATTALIAMKSRQQPQLIEPDPTVGERRGQRRHVHQGSCSLNLGHRGAAGRVGHRLHPCGDRAMPVVAIRPRLNHNRDERSLQRMQPADLPLDSHQRFVAGRARQRSKRVGRRQYVRHDSPPHTQTSLVMDDQTSVEAGRGRRPAKQTVPEHAYDATIR
jgi:hypothetical protein